MSVNADFSSVTASTAEHVIVSLSLSSTSLTMQIRQRAVGELKLHALEDAGHGRNVEKDESDRRLLAEHIALHMNNR